MAFKELSRDEIEHLLNVERVVRLASRPAASPRVSFQVDTSVP
jgi:hypothetical protein